MKKKLTIVWHILAWTFLTAFQVYRFYNDYQLFGFLAPQVKASGFSPFIFYLIFESTFFLVSIAAFYAAYFWIAPYLYPSFRWFKAMIGLLGAIMATVLARYLVEFHIHLPFLHFDNYNGHPYGWYEYTKNCILFHDDYFLYGICVYVLLQSYRIRNQKAQAELAFLKSQTNPHFLFNTINDIYALTYQKSDEAPEALLKLSDMLRYSLYDGAADHVPLKKELDYLQDYLDLHRYGAKQRSYIQFKIEGDPGNLQIAPLLLVPFLENIIKHGVTDDPSQPAAINVRMGRKGFSLDAVNVVKDHQKDQTGGIGLASVRRRLELLYPNRHRFVIRQENGTFHCQMEIAL
jgi:two-component system LytT family sensor kinase